ncbi:hypothetical protein Gohar_016920 [Gossypium harknessii]|uniref:DUF4283 domain-containing protein n=1 Tax=Gossypium harknessii TaxID=34285 RepID=A0A7J9G4C9_9ROSI|nr:hypothetical protein [Gossypium harknessii]
MESEMATLSIEDGEEEPRQINLGDDGTEAILDFYVVGSFLIASVIQFQAMRTTLIDLGKVLEGSPWTFNNHLLVFHRLKHVEDLLQVPLFHVDY